MHNNICPDFKLDWESDFTLLGFYIDNKLEKLQINLDNIHKRVTALIHKWKVYNLSVHGRITIAKSILLAQYNYIGSVLDMFYPSDYKHIQNTLNHFVIYNELYSIDHKRRPWIPDDVLYGPRKLGGFAMIKIEDFFYSLKAGWIRRYIKGLDDHWTAMLYYNPWT